MTGGWITQADRERRQRDAVGELAAILDAHPGLPLLAWVVGSAGASLAGRIAGLVPDADARAAFTAWQQALGLGDVLEIPAAGGSAGWLQARTRRGNVRITVTAVTGGEDAS